MTPGEALGFWSGRHVFVTGGTGLIGSWLVKKLLAAGARVALLVRDVHPQSEIVRSGDMGRVGITYGCVEDFAALRRAINVHEADTVFHLAAQTQVIAAHRDPLETLEANVRGTYNVLEACRAHPQLVKRVIVASSDKAYGAHEVLPYTEDMPLLARQSYEVSKSCADLIAQAYFQSYRVPVAVTRFGNVYGGGDWNLNRIVPGTILSLARSHPPVIRSDGTPLRDYIYVEDVAEAYLRLAERLDEAGLAGEPFNFSHGDPVSVRAIVDVLRRLMRREDLQPLIRNTARGEIERQSLDAGKAKRLLGWSPRFGLQEGLERTVAWYRDALGTPPA